MCLVCNTLEALMTPFCALMRENVDLISKLICLNYLIKENRKHRNQDLEFKSCEKNLNDDFTSSLTMLIS